MWSKFIHFEVIVICILSLIPWPGPSVFKISCSRESARVVRKIVQSKWLPILEKYHVKIPLECPFHPMRDIFGPQQAAKVQNRPSQWTCGFCGKSFYEEQHLDQHFEHRHGGNINMAEDAVCLADYCDIMRCKVLVSKETGDGANGMSTDIEIWREATTYRTALQATGPRDLAKIPTSHHHSTSKKPTDQESAATASSAASSAKLAPDDSTQQSSAARRQHCQKKPSNAQPDKRKRKRRRTSAAEDDDDDDDGGGEDDDDDDDDDDDEEDDDDDDQKKSPANKRRRDDEETDADANATASSCEDEHLVDSMRSPIDHKEQRILEMQRMKANCKADDLERLKTRCEILTRGCVVGLLGQMADEEFYKMEDELNKAVCWYLTCDRYWEDGPMEQRPFPWGLVFVLVMVLSLGVCFCYYIIWILFDTDDQHHGFGGSILHGQHYLYDQQHHQQHHHLHPQQLQQQQQHHQYALHSSPTHHQYLHSNAMVASSIGGYATPVQQHHVVQQHHPHQLHQQQAHSTHHGPHGPSGLLTSHPPSSSAAGVSLLHTSSVGAGVVAGTSTINTATAVAAGGGGGHQQQQQHHHHHPQQQQQLHPQQQHHQQPYSDEFYVAPEFNQELAGQSSEHYIYVTYPPELKRRLLESCYNRTTRL